MCRDDYRGDYVLNRNCFCLIEDDEFVSIGLFKGRDYSRYSINKYSIVKKENGVIVKTIRGVGGYPQVALVDHRTGKAKGEGVHQLMGRTYLKEHFTSEKMVVDHITSNKQNNQLSNLRIVTQRENTIFACGVLVVVINKVTNEEQLYLSLSQCVEEYYTMYPTLYTHLINKYEYETEGHVFYKDEAKSRTRTGESFYIDVGQEDDDEEGDNDEEGDDAEDTDN